MNAEENKSGDQKLQEKEHPGRADKVNIFSGVLTAASFIVTILGLLFFADLSYLLVVVTAIVVAVGVFAIYLFRQAFAGITEWLHRGLGRSAPWLVLAVLILVGVLVYLTVQHYRLSMLIYSAVEPAKKTRVVPFDSARGAIFNSWDHQLQQNRYISAFGDRQKLMWLIDQEGGGHFSYKVDSNVQPNTPNASSGGYMTFYGTPCDRLVYREISFACRATDARGQVDIGIRLAVDDPNAQGDRERVAYEVPSIREYYRTKRNINESWQTFTIDIGDFQQTRTEPPLPQGIDENTINKIVFFVSNETVKSCPEGTLWFRDVKFNSDKH